MAAVRSRRVTLLAVGSLVFACASQVAPTDAPAPAPAPGTPSSAATARGPAPPPTADAVAARARAPNTGYVGHGLTGCAAGDALSTCVAVLGEPTALKQNFATFASRGVQLRLTDAQRVDAVFLFFMSKKYAAFGGSLEKGINAKSSVDDVIAVHGKPNHIGNSTVSEYGEYPGVHDRTLVYGGARFTFYDGALAVVGLFATETSKR
jgi:hypothetical protein